MLLSSARSSARLLLPCAAAARRYVAPAVLAALGEYGERHGHVRVPQSFVVPDGDGWAAGARGLKLGNQVSTLRKKKQQGQ